MASGARSDQFRAPGGGLSSRTTNSGRQLHNDHREERDDGEDLKLDECGGGSDVRARIRACHAGQFDGVTVNVMTQTGAIQEPLQRRAPDFEKMTGAKINIIAVPFSDLYQKVLTDWASGTNSVDAAVFAPQWMVDYVSGSYLEELGPRSPRTKISSGIR